eukprot:3540280-Prymnesium_polylepis.1
MAGIRQRCLLGGTEGAKPAVTAVSVADSDLETGGMPAHAPEAAYVVRALQHQALRPGGRHRCRRR